MKQEDIKQKTNDVFSKLGVTEKLPEAAITVSYKAGINRVVIDFKGSYQPDTELVHSKYVQNSAVPAWAETAMDIFSRYFYHKERNDGS